MSKVILLSGVPGSGKSSLVNKMSLAGDVTVCSADHYFEKTGQYVFDVTRMGDAHGECLRKFTNALFRNDELIVVDNTNTSALELAPYVALAQAFNASCEIITVDCDPQLAFERNVHNVPLNTIRRMADAIKTRVIPRFWNVKYSWVSASV